MLSPRPQRESTGAPLSVSPRRSLRAARTPTIARLEPTEPRVPAYLRAPAGELEGFETFAPGMSPVVTTVPAPAPQPADASVREPVGSAGGALRAPSAEDSPGIETEGDEAHPEGAAGDGGDAAEGEGAGGPSGDAAGMLAQEAEGAPAPAASPAAQDLMTATLGAPRRLGAADATEETVGVSELPLPETGLVALYRQPLSITARIPAFTAPTYLRHTPASLDPQLSPELKSYAARFAEAASAALRLYGEVAGLVRQLDTSARDLAENRAGRRQQALETALLRLDADLAEARLRLHAAQRISLSSLEETVLATREAIRRTAGRATGSLRARALRIDTDLRGEQGHSGRILAFPGAKSAALDQAKITAERGMDTLVAEADTRLHAPRTDDTGAAMMAAKNEALAQNIRLPVAEAKLLLPNQVNGMKEGVMRLLGPAQTSVCSAFCPFNDWKAMLREQAVEAVGSARARSVARLLDSARDARTRLAAMFHDAEKALIEQHDQTRRRLIEAARQRETGEHSQAEEQANQQAAMMGAVAGAQSVAVTSIDGSLAARRGSQESEFARAVIAASDGLVADGVPAGRLQAAKAGAAIARARAGLDKAGEQGNRQFVEGARGSGAQLTATADATSAAARGMVRDIGQNMARLADPIRETLQSFLLRVNSQFQAQKTQLGQNLDNTETRMVQGFEGRTSGSNDNNEGNGNGNGNREAAEPSPCQQSCRSNEDRSTPTPTPTPSAGNARAPESAKAFIDRLNGYGTNPEAEPTIACFIATAPKTVSSDLAGRAGQLHGKLGYTDSDPYAVLDILRGLTRKQGAAVEESYGGAGVLRADLDHYLNTGNLFTSPTTRLEAIFAARAYLNGNTEAGVIHELNIATNWSNDSERIDTVMQSLTPDQMRSLDANYGSELAVIRADLNELDTRVFDDMRRGDVGSAIARRMQVSIDEARETRGDRGADAAVDAIAARYNVRGASRLAGAAQFEAFEGATAREARQAEAWNSILAGFARIQGVTEDEGATSGTRGDALIAYATGARDYDVFVPDENPRGESGGHWETRSEGVSPAQARLIANIVRCGEGSPEARAARLAVELGRPGGANPDRVRIATDDPALNAAAVDPQANRQAIERQRRMYELVDQYAPPPNAAAGPNGAQRSAADIRADVANRLAAGIPQDDRRAAYVRALVVGNPADPASVIARLDFAMEGAGTSNDVLRQTLGTLTREQFEKVREQYDATHDIPLLTRIGIRGRGDWWDSETSGDTANELEVLSLGIPRNDRERAEVAALRMRQQISQAGSLGPTLAGEEFDRLNADYRRLMSVMGADDVGFGADGSFETRGVDGHRVTLGRFDENGAFIPRDGFSSEDLAVAMTVGQISAENYKAATDRIADGIATALVVAAAIVTTALTGGAAASIWIPVLVTAAAGVASMGVKYAIKGGRYGSEEMMLDLASTVVQAATAGIGAAAGAALRGGSKAVGALATSMRASEEALAVAAAGGAGVTKALPGLTLGHELFVGALSSGFAGGANAAINPDSYRSDHYASDILHGIVRGSISGAAGAGVTRGLTGGINSLARGTGAASGAREALRRGASFDAASRMASLRAQAYGTSALTEIGGRALGSGVSGMITRGTELAYDRVALGRRLAWHQAINELGAAFVQNLVQGFGEGAADRMMRSYSASRRAEHAFTTRDDHLDFRQRGRAAMEAEARRMGLLPPGADLADGVPGAPRPTPPSAGEAAPENAPASRPTVAVEEDGTVMPLALRTDDAEGGTPPLTARPAAGEAAPAAGPRVLDPANDNPGGAAHQRVALSDVDMVTMPRAQEGAVFVHPDTKNRMAANDNFGRLINADPTREVAIHYNPVTGEHVVIQGDATSVATIRPGGELSGPGANGRLVSVNGVPDPSGHWIVLAHFHPNRLGQEGTALIRRLPSGFTGDFGIVHYESVGLGHGERSSRIYFSDNGHVAYTDFGVSPGHPEGRFWIDYPDPVTGNRVRQHFVEPSDYHAFLNGVRNNPELASTGGNAARTPGLHTADDADAPPRPASAAGETADQAPEGRPARTSAGESEGSTVPHQADDDPHPSLARLAELEAALDKLGPRIDSQGKLTALGSADLETKLATAGDLFKEVADLPVGDPRRRAREAQAIRLIERAARFYGADADMLSDFAIRGRRSEEVAQLFKVESDPDFIGPEPPRRPDPGVAEVDRMISALQDADPNGPLALIDRIKAGGSDRDIAQAQLNAQSSAPKGAELISFSTSTLELAFAFAGGVPESGRAGKKTVVIDGHEMVIFSPRPDPDPDGRLPPPSIAVEMIIPPAVPGKPVVYQFFDGALRVWHGEPTSEHPQGILRQETIIAPARQRIGHEERIKSHGVAGANLAGAPTERAHLHGGGLGQESSFGIGHAPREVNQIIQNKGIERLMRNLRDWCASEMPGATLSYQTDVEFHPGPDQRQSRITYKLDITIEGKRIPFAEFAIGIEADAPGTPPAQRRGSHSSVVDPIARRYSHDSPRINRLFDALWESVDVPGVLTTGLAQARSQNIVLRERLARMRPEAVARAVAMIGALTSHNPGPKDVYRPGRWEARLVRLIKHPDTPTYIVIDLRTSNLTERQKLGIFEAINRLPDAQRYRVVVIE